jgi:carbon-monoxide dehydrogenase small subunit
MSSRIGVTEELSLPATGSQEIPISVNINGRTHETAVAADLLLLDFLRDTLGLTGAKPGCETGQCGSCVVLIDGVSVKSCARLAAQTDGSQVTTIEGVAPNGELSPLQRCMWEAHAVQCGYCTPGLILSLTDLLQRDAHPDPQQVRRWMDGNMCRCSVYQNAVRAVEALTSSSQA